MLIKGRPVEVKELSAEGEFSGYAARYGNVDNGGDLITPGAFGEFMKTANATGIRVLWQHDWDKPIGVNLDWSEDDTGLKVEGRLLLDVQQAKECQILAKAQAIGGLSIGYGVMTGGRSYGDDGVRVLSRLKLWEYSFVTFPMNDEAVITDMKSDVDAAELKTLQQCHEYLVDACGLPLAKAKKLVLMIRGAAAEVNTKIDDDAGLVTAALSRLQQTLANGA